MIGVLILLVLVAVVLWTAPKRREDTLKTASLSVLEERARQQPDDPRVGYYLGMRLRGAGKISEAEQAFRHAAERDIDHEDLWLAWAETTSVQQESQQAFQILSLFIAKNPKSANAHLALARCYERSRTYKRAYEEAAIATKLNPTNADAWRVTGVNAMAWSPTDEAITALRQAVTLRPRDWRNQIALGDALAQRKDRDGALACLREAVRLAPMEAVAHLSLGRFLLLQAKTPAQRAVAQQSLLTSTTLGPTIPLAHLMLGQVYGQQGEWSKARESLETARKLAPDDDKVSFALARAYGHVGDTVAAKQESDRHTQLLAYRSKKRRLQEGIVQNPDDIPLRLELARLYASHGDNTEAMWQYQQILGRKPDMEIVREEAKALEKQPTLSARGTTSSDPEPSSSLRIQGAYP